MPHVLERLDKVRQFRRNSKSAPTQKLADTPTLYHVNVIPDRSFLAVPEVSSERREYVPIAFLAPPIIPSNLVRVLLDADLWHFGVLTSRMHMAWLREIGGRLESRYRYSIDIVYHNFPWPAAEEKDRDRIRKLAQKVLDARAAYPEATLADLYDRLAMPPALRKAHSDLDTAIERLYRPQAFVDDRERVEYLLALYEALASPLLSVARQQAKRRSRR